jgi:hypothetical protein
MDLYGKQQYEDLDFVTQATEPIQDEIIGIFNSLPESIELNFQNIKEMFSKDSYSWRLTVSNPIQRVIGLHLSESVDYETKKDIYGLYKFSISDGAEVDFSSWELTGTLVVTKTCEYVPESLLKIRLARASSAFNTHSVAGELDISRANEIMDLLGGCQKGLSTRSPRVKYETIRLRFNEIFENDEWKVRDELLARKVCKWAKEYIYTGNMAAMTNFCALKVMTHGGLPIYKMSEVE